MFTAVDCCLASRRTRRHVATRQGECLHLALTATKKRLLVLVDDKTTLTDLFSEKFLCQTAQSCLPASQVGVAQLSRVHTWGSRQGYVCCLHGSVWRDFLAPDSSQTRAHPLAVVCLSLAARRLHSCKGRQQDTVSLQWHLHESLDVVPMAL